MHNPSTRVCGNFRPDFRCDLFGWSLIVEVDEYQHKAYNKDAEIDRMQNITEGMGWPCLFIRYNPDAYHTIGKTVRVSKQKRLAQLKETIIYHFSRNYQASF